MNFPEQLKYTKEHEWISLEGNVATIGITEFAQGELGDIVYIDIETIGKELTAEAVFGTVEAVKTVSDLFYRLLEQSLKKMHCSLVSQNLLIKILMVMVG